ncbi:MAG: hypothetical protein JWP08_2785, partial [Bryobacterales bacterium]|nr:hypothetical protein [Bryobacterales bacterium]
GKINLCQYSYMVTCQPGQNCSYLYPDAEHLRRVQDMKTTKLFFAGVAIAISLWASDPNGKWTGEFPGAQGNTVHSVITLKAEGDAVTGSVEGMRGGETAISDGKVNGEDIVFSVVREWQGQQFKMIYHGKLKGNTIHFTVSREGGEGGGREFDARRAAR